MEEVDYISGRGSCEAGSNRVLISIDDIPLIPRLGEPQKFRLSDILVEELNDATPKELSENITKIDVELEYLSEADAQRCWAAAVSNPEQLRPPNGTWSTIPIQHSFRVIKPIRLKFMHKFLTRIKDNFKKNSKRNKFIEWGENAFDIAVVEDPGRPDRKHINFRLPPGGVIFTHNPVMFDLMGIPQDMQTGGVESEITYVANYSDTEPLIFQGMEIVKNFYSLPTLDFLHHSLVTLQGVSEDTIDEVLLPAYDDPARATDVNFAMMSSVVPFRKRVYITRAQKGVNTVETAKEILIPVLKQFLTERQLPDDLVLIDTNDDGQLAFAKNQKYAIEGGIRLTAKLVDAPEKLLENNHFGHPLDLRTETLQEKRFNIIPLSNKLQDETEIMATLRKFRRADPQGNQPLENAVAKELARPKNPHYVVLLNVDPNLNRVSKILGGIYLVIGFLDSSDSIQPSKPFYLPSYNSCLELGLLSVRTQALRTFSSRCKVTLCLQSVSNKRSEWKELP